jgi:Glu-tRNA(Gln) amidotransferase subunit E-like FAD-binding protein
VAWLGSSLLPGRNPGFWVSVKPGLAHDAAEQIRAGNGKAIGAIVGAVMKETKGRADGGEVNRLIRAQLGG